MAALVVMFGVGDAGSRAQADDALLLGTALAIVGGAAATAHLVAGRAVRREKAWGRILGVALCCLAFVVAGYAMINYVIDLGALSVEYWASGQADLLGLLLYPVVFIGGPTVAYAMTLVLLVRGGRPSRPIGG